MNFHNKYEVDWLDDDNKELEGDKEKDKFADYWKKVKRRAEERSKKTSGKKTISEPEQLKDILSELVKK